MPTPLVTALAALGGALAPTIPLVRLWLRNRARDKREEGKALAAKHEAEAEIATADITATRETNRRLLARIEALERRLDREHSDCDAKLNGLRSELETSRRELADARRELMQARTDLGDAHTQRLARAEADAGELAQAHRAVATLTDQLNAARAEVLRLRALVPPAPSPR